MNPLMREKILNFSSLLVFMVVLIATGLIAREKNFVFADISLTDGVIMILSTYRLSRMIVYEKLFSLFRYLLQIGSSKPILGSINNLILCPWCTSVWISIFIFNIYYFVPLGNLLCYLLAISSIASPLIVLSNNLTLQNDILKNKKEKLFKL